MAEQNKILTSDRLTSFFFYLSILFFIIGFNFSDNRAGGWTQQFMPDLGGRQITDITFLDSLTGYAVTSYTANDTAYILKTTNGGDNWNIVLRGPTNTIGGFNRIQFVNSNTGFACRNFLWKTTNAGLNWFNVNTSGIFPENMYVLNNDTIWIIDSDGLVGGVFRTTNGGASWQQQLALGSQNPNHIYMFNGRIGFICKDNVYLRRTSDGGLNWSLVSGENGYTDMYFSDSLIGWKCSVFGMKKTLNGGLNWSTQTLPSGGIIQTNGISSFSSVNKDTIWGNGGYVLYPNNEVRSILNRTVDGGNNWLFQIPDTATIDNIVYYYVNFVDKLNGWGTDNIPIRGEIHTTTGGDTIFYTSVKQISSKTPDEFNLGQNYPNPFNPITIIRFQIQRLANLKIVIYDVSGKEITTLADKEYKTGAYEVTFDGSNYSSRVYFYSLIVDGKLYDTKRMVLLK